MSDPIYTVTGDPDRPIRSADQDKLEREVFIERLANALIDRNTKKARGVVLGVTGPWGSGKSSILNLLKQHIANQWPDALIVSFYPWLISGRNDLISEFIAELLGTIQSEPKLKKRLKGFTKTVAQYGAHLAGANEERGRAYLEKIVQLQIPLPLLLEEECERLLSAELSAMRLTAHLPDEFLKNERYAELKDIVLSTLISTPRDIKRLTGSFHAIAGMVGLEVDWVDLLAYCVLLSKAPRLVEKLRKYPEDVLDNPVSKSAIMRSIAEDRASPDKRLDRILECVENSHDVRNVIQFLFPRFSPDRRRSNESTEALSLRRPLLTTLRLGLLPGGISRNRVEKFLSLGEDDIDQTLGKMFNSEELPVFLDRLDDIYFRNRTVNHVILWRGISKFIKKPAQIWPTSWSPMFEIVRTFDDLLEVAVARRPEFREQAAAVFDELEKNGDVDLVSRWIYGHFFTYGIMGQEERKRDVWFLSRERVEEVSRQLSSQWRRQHLEGILLPSIWSLQPVFIMLGTEVWDAACRDSLTSALDQDEAVDGFALHLFGGNYVSERRMIDQMCSLTKFLDRVEQRLKNRDNLDVTLVAALERALNRIL